MLEQRTSHGTEFVRNDMRRKTSLPSFDVLTNYARDGDWSADAGVAWGGSWMPPRVGEWQLHPVLPVDERCARLPLACRREEAAVSNPYESEWRPRRSKKCFAPSCAAKAIGEAATASASRRAAAIRPLRLADQYRERARRGHHRDDRISHLPIPLSQKTLGRSCGPTLPVLGDQLGQAETLA